jgi:hypothetical protein
MNPLGSFGQPSNPNGQEMCIRCYKPETSRGFVIQGDAAWTIAAMHQFGGIPIKQATAMVQERYDAEGWEWTDRAQDIVVLCRGCAKITGAPVHSMASLQAGAEVTGVIQPVVEGDAA